MKKSNKIAPAHRLQLLYYLYVLEQNGILGATGILEYPKLRKTEEVLLTDIDRENIKKIMADIEEITESLEYPPCIESRICKLCSYYDFCFSGEES